MSGRVGPVETFGGTGDPEERAVGQSEGLLSLASWLGVSLAEVLELRDAGKLGQAIETRNAKRRGDPLPLLAELRRKYRG